MFTVENYVLAESLEQAYELNQSRRNKIIGGMLWLKMGRKKYRTAIDLSALGLNKIEEDDESYKIGCMCTLREVELHSGLNRSFNGMLAKAVGDIVGVQLRNSATVGGSVYSRFGFSDVLTALLSLDSYVELYRGGLVPLAEYIGRPLDRDILVRIVLKKDGRKTAYASCRASAGDLPLLNCAVSNLGGQWSIVLGARPHKAHLTKIAAEPQPTQEEIDSLSERIAAETAFGSNCRGSGEYRHILARVLIARNIEAIRAGGSYGY